MGEKFSDSKLPRINLFTMFRLGLYQMGLGIMSLLTLGVINRVAIDELKIAPFIVAGAIATYQFVSPARIWFGQRSDAKPIFGYHRSGYIWIGTALFTIFSFLALQVVWQLGLSWQTVGLNGQSYAWSGLLALVFALYGICLSAGSTPFAALLVDVSDEDNRPRLISVVWSMLMIGIVVGAMITGTLLNTAFDSSQSSELLNIPELKSIINPIFIIMPGIVFMLSLLAIWGIEKKYSRFYDRSSTSDREEEMNLGKALKILTASRQTGIFFTFLLILTISLFMQDSVLEPYGGEVFKMSIAETTKLNIPYGIGTLIGIGFTGFAIVPRLGKKNTTKFGCLGVAVCFLLIILSGFYVNQNLLKFSLFLFGIFSGIITAGATSLMLDLTAAETAGTFIGAWGLAQAMARGIATMVGGAVLNLGQIIFEVPILAYGLVFAMQACGMMLAIWFLRNVSIKEFRDKTEIAIATVMEGELEG